MSLSGEHLWSMRARDAMLCGESQRRVDCKKPSSIRCEVQRDRAAAGLGRHHAITRLLDYIQNVVTLLFEITLNTYRNH